MYSRITGYYRPVQNWNDGKSQEFKQRKTYDIAHSVLHKKNEAKAEADCECCCDAEIKDDDVILFATKTCPNCKVAASFLDKAGISYRKLYAEESEEEFERFGITGAPTLVVIKDGNFETIYNASNIRKYADSHKA